MYLKAFKTQVYDKLFISENDAENYGYSSMVVPLLNECLAFIANGDISVRKTVSHLFKPALSVTSLPDASEAVYEACKKAVYMINDEYSDEYGYWTVTRSGVAGGYTYEWTATSDPLQYTFSTADNVISVKYADTKVLGASFYIREQVDGRLTVIVNKPGRYDFIVETLYPEVPENDSEEDDSVLNSIPASIAHVAVLYVVSQLLMDTDQTRAQIIRNEYELALSRLDINRQDLQESFSITERW